MLSTRTFTFDAARHAYLMDAGIQAPSVTQVLKRAGLVSFDQVRADFLERASSRGRAVHQITEFIDRDLADCSESEIDFDPINEEYRPYIHAWMKFKRESESRILVIEDPRLAEVNGMPYGMTFDRLAIINGREAVLDIKTSSFREHWWGLQCAGYDLGLDQCEKQLHRDRYAVQLRPDGTYGLWAHTDDGDYDAFTWGLALTWWMLNHGYKLD